MIGTDEYNKVTAQPTDRESAPGSSSETNQSQSTMMECKKDDNIDGDAHADGDGTGGGPRISPNGESRGEIEEPVEWSLQPSSSYQPLSFGISGIDAIFEETDGSNVIYGLENVDNEPTNGKTVRNYEVRYIGLYKLVSSLSKPESEQPSEAVMPESSTPEDATQ